MLRVIVVAFCVSFALSAALKLYSVAMSANMYFIPAEAMDSAVIDKMSYREGQAYIDSKVTALPLRETLAWALLPPGLWHTLHEIWRSTVPYFIGCLLFYWVIRRQPNHSLKLDGPDGPPT